MQTSTVAANTRGGRGCGGEPGYFSGESGRPGTAEGRVFRCLIHGELRSRLCRIVVILGTISAAAASEVLLISHVYPSARPLQPSWLSRQGLRLARSKILIASGKTGSELTSKAMSPTSTCRATDRRSKTRSRISTLCRRLPVIRRKIVRCRTPFRPTRTSRGLDPGQPRSDAKIHLAGSSWTGVWAV